MTIKKISALVLSLILIASVLVLPVSAKKTEDVPYLGYEYDNESKSVAAPVTYVHEKTVSYKDLGLGKAITEPKDIMRRGNALYVLDSGNSRVIELNLDLTLKGVRDKFVDKEGNPVTFTGATGFTMSDEGILYITDKENRRILAFNSSNLLVKTIEKPETSLVGFDFDFDVNKIIINNQGLLYVTVASVNDGAFTFTQDGEFLHFFGKNTVTKTVDVILNFFKKKFLTREQLQKQMASTPIGIANFDIDDKGFLYTIAATNQLERASGVRKLNFKSGNIYDVNGVVKEFGDLEYDRLFWTANRFTNFTDVDVDDLGFIFLVDVGRNRIFQYSADGQLIGTFGGSGKQYGLLQSPVAVETAGTQVYVLENNGTIVEYKPTEYATYLREAFLDLDTSDPQKAITAWNKVLELNTNSLYPYYGLGMAYEKLGDYKSAMENFKLSNSKAEYSDAFREYRKQFIADNLWLLLIGAVAGIALIVFVSKFISKKIKAASNAAYSVLENKYTFPLYTLTHPSDGFGQFKYRPDLPSWRMSAIIVVVLFFTNVIQYFGTGYCFNDNTAADYSILSTLIATVILYILFVVGNWAVCSLLDGNGKMKEIATVTAYSLIPYIVSQLLCVILSNFLSGSEGVTLTIITTIGVIWSVMLVFIGLGAVNQYYAGKNFFTILLTIFAMIVLALIIFLFFSLIQQVLYFIESIWDEYLLR